MYTFDCQPKLVILVHYILTLHAGFLQKDIFPLKILDLINLSNMLPLYVLSRRAGRAARAAQLL